MELATVDGAAEEFDAGAGHGEGEIIKDAGAFSVGLGSDGNGKIFGLLGSDGAAEDFLRDGGMIDGDDDGGAGDVRGIDGLGDTGPEVSAVSADLIRSLVAGSEVLFEDVGTGSAEDVQKRSAALLHELAKMGGDFVFGEGEGDHWGRLSVVGCQWEALAVVLRSFSSATDNGARTTDNDLSLWAMPLAMAAPMEFSMSLERAS